MPPILGLTHVEEAGALPLQPYLTNPGSTPSTAVSVPSQLFLLGTGGNGQGSGPDGQDDQYWNGSSWVNTANLFGSTGCWLASACWEPNTKLFYLFGSTDGTAQAVTYNPVSNTWASIASIAPNNGTYVNAGVNGGHGVACALNGLIYLFGGYSPGNSVAPEVQVYNPGSNAYTQLNNFPNPTYGTGGFGCTANGVIYVGGGSNGGATCTPLWYRYNQSNDTYTSLANLPASLTEAGCAFFNGSIWCVGGANNADGAGTNGVYRYNIAGDSWTTMNNYPIAAGIPCCAIWNGSLYALGGITAAAYPNFVTAVYVYNPGVDSWSLHSNLTSSLAGSVAGYTGS